MNYLFNPDPQFLINEAATPMRSDVKFEDCKSICDQTNGCESFSYCNDGSCYPHKRHLNGAEKSFESGVEHECFTSFKIGKLHIQNYKFYIVKQMIMQSKLILITMKVYILGLVLQ